MVNFRYILTIAYCIAFIFKLNAQTADDVISRHIDAMGGRSVLSQIKSISVESVVQVQGSDAPSTLTILNGKGYRLESEFNGQKIIQVYTDRGGWSLNPMSGFSDAQPLTQEQYRAGKDQMDIGGPLYNYSAKGNKVEFLGKDGGQFKIKATSRDNNTTVFYIDPLSYFITKSVQSGTMMGQPMQVTRTFSNFQKTDFGYIIPFTIDINYGGGFNLTSNVRKVLFNPDIDPKIFEMPGR